MDGHMRTLIRLAYIFVFSLTLFPLGSNAGVGTSGGGHVIVCDGRSADTLGYVTLLDIYEAEHVFKMSLRIPQTSLHEELNVLASQLQIVLGSSVRMVGKPRSIHSDDVCSYGRLWSHADSSYRMRC